MTAPKSTFIFEDAEYRNATDERDFDNPFVLALPELPEDIKIIQALGVKPKFILTDRDLPNNQRMLKLDLLGNLLVPFPRHVKLVRSAWKLLVTGYRARKPFSAAEHTIAKDLYRQQQSGDFVSVRAQTHASQHSMALIGASGSGKTFFIHHLAGMFPPVIYHPELGKWQIPFLIIQMSYDGESVHTLADAIFMSLHRLMPDAMIEQEYVKKSSQNAERRLNEAFKLAFEYGVGMIVIDESQNRKYDQTPEDKKQSEIRRKARSESLLIKLLITASNTSRIPLLFTGTLELKTTHIKRFTLARRLAGRGSSKWLPLECSGSISEPGEFEIFMAVLFKYQWIRKPIALSDTWVELFFHFTQGIVDIAVKLWQSCQSEAISNGSETITPELVNKAFEDEFMTADFGISALREKDTFLLEAVSDLFDTPSEEDHTDSATPELPTGAKPVPRQAKIRKAKPPLPSPTPAPLSVDTIAKADMRAPGANAGVLGQASQNEWQKDLQQ